MCEAVKKYGDERETRGRLEEIYDSVAAKDYSPERGAQKLKITVDKLKRDMLAEGYPFPV